MSDNTLPVVFVHGWSVTHTNTYGGLPERLAAEAAAAGHRFVGLAPYRRGSAFLVETLEVG